MDKILDVTEKTIEDLSIYSKELFPFKPITGTDYNSPGVIQINIENQDQWESNSDWLIDRVEKLYKVFSPRIKQINNHDNQFSIN